MSFWECLSADQAGPSPKIKKPSASPPASEAMAYGRKEQEELNDGLSPNEKAVVGYCYILGYAQPIKNLVNSKFNWGKNINNEGI